MHQGALCVTTRLIHLSFCSYRTDFNSTAELARHIGTPTNESKSEIQSHPVIADTKISNCLMQFEAIFHERFVRFIH